MASNANWPAVNDGNSKLLQIEKDTQQPPQPSLMTSNASRRTIAQSSQPSQRLSQIQVALKRELQISDADAMLYAEKVCNVRIPHGHDAKQWWVYGALLMGCTPSPSVLSKFLMMEMSFGVSKTFNDTVDGRVLLDATNTWTSVNTSHLLTHQISSSNHQDLHVMSIDDDAPLGLLHESPNKLKTLTGFKGTYLYHGFASVSQLDRYLTTRIGPRLMAPNAQGDDFGYGFYTTFDYDTALIYALDGYAQGGVLIFEWDEPEVVEEGWSVTHLDIDTWTKVVKRNLCMNLKPSDACHPLGAPPAFENDARHVVQGAISDNYAAVKLCHRPQPSSVEQVVFTCRVQEIMFKRLVGIVLQNYRDTLLYETDQDMKTGDPEEQSTYDDGLPIVLPAAVARQRQQ